MSSEAARATSYITNRLETGFFNKVTNGDVKDIVGKLRSLNAGDTDRVIDNLARAGKLDELTSEIMDGSILGLGGLSNSERGAFFADMAKKLDANSLARLTNEFIATDGKSVEGDARARELGAAIATHASPGVKLDYIRALAPQSTDQRGLSTFTMGVHATTKSDPQASAIVSVLGSLRGPAAAQGFAALSPNQLASVLRASTQAETISHRGHTSQNYDADGFGTLMTAAGTIPSADTKARLFDAGVTTLRGVRDEGSGLGFTVMGKQPTLSTMTDGLTTVLRSDPSGIVSELNQTRATSDGGDLSIYAAEMLKSGKADQLGRMMAQLQSGNALNQNPVDRLYVEQRVPGKAGDVIRPHAEALGYFVGAVQRGTQIVTKDVADQRELTTAVLKTMLTVVDKSPLGKVGGGAVGISASLAKEWVALGIKAAIRDTTADIGKRLEQAALPYDHKADRVVIGQNATDAFDGAVNRVLRSAIP